MNGVTFDKRAVDRKDLSLQFAKFVMVKGIYGGRRRVSCSAEFQILDYNLDLIFRVWGEQTKSVGGSLELKFQLGIWRKILSQCTNIVMNRDIEMSPVTFGEIILSLFISLIQRGSGCV